jgi:hypothetical protein
MATASKRNPRCWANLENGANDDQVPTVPSNLVPSWRTWQGERWKVARHEVPGVLLARGAYNVLMVGQWWVCALVLIGLIEA